MSRKVLLATEKPFAREARDQIVEVLNKADYEVILLESYKEKKDLLVAVAEVEAMIVRSDKVDKEVLDAGANLKLVVRAGAGYDNVDCAHAKTNKIAVMNTPGQNSNAVAELAMGMMVFAARSQFSGKSGTELKGKTLGIHAIGHVGTHVARIAKGFGMTVLGFHRYFTPAEIAERGAQAVGSAEELYAKSEYISVHVPLNDSSRGLIGKKLLMSMPKGACVINTARKEVINEADLIEVFAERSDFRYLADVGIGEQTGQLLKEKYPDRFFVTPKKMGAQTAEANLNAGVAAAHQIVGFFDGGAKNFIVNA